MSSRRRVLSAFLVLAVAALSSSTLGAQTRTWDGDGALCKGANLRGCIDEQVTLTDLTSFAGVLPDARNVHAPSSIGHPDNVNGRWMLTGWEFAQIVRQGVRKSVRTTFDGRPLTTVDDSPSLGYAPAGDDVFLDFTAPADDLTHDSGIASAPSGEALELTATETTTAPEPGTIALLATGMAGLVAWRRRRDR